MKVSARWALLFFLLLWLAGGMARAGELETIVAKARAYLGSETALNGVRTVRFVGNLTTGDKQKATFEIIFQKPYRHRIVTSTADQRETTALDGYEAWQRYEDLRNPGSERLSIMEKDQVKRLRANTWENLAFYRGLERKGGRVEDQGTTEINGRTARKISFIHDTGSIFTRYFDQETGRLLLTENEQGGTIQEEGEMWVGGIRFPRRILTQTTLNDGKTRVVTLEFTNIAINESFADEIFTVPLLEAPSSKHK